VDRDLILQLAGILGSTKDNEHSANVRLQCPLAPATHAKGTDRHPAWSVRVVPDGPSPTMCWACDTAGTLEQVLEKAVELVGGPELEAGLAFVKENDGGGLQAAMTRLRIADRDVKPEKDAIEPWEPKKLSRYVARCGRTVSQYVLDRGLVAGDIQRWRIGYDEGPTLVGQSYIRYRVVFPIWDETGALVGASMRTVVDEPPKYRDWPMTPKGDVFYGEHRIDTTRDEVVIVEGILDVVMASRYLPNVVGLLGANTGMGETRLEKLRRWTRRVTLVLDADQAGSEAVEGKVRTWTGRDGKQRQKKDPGLLDILRRHFVVRVAELPAGTDPAELREAVVPYVRRAKYLGLSSTRS